MAIRRINSSRHGQRPFAAVSQSVNPTPVDTVHWFAALIPKYFQVLGRGLTSLVGYFGIFNLTSKPATHFQPEGACQQNATPADFAPLYGILVALTISQRKEDAHERKAAAGGRQLPVRSHRPRRHAEAEGGGTGGAAPGDRRSYLRHPLQSGEESESAYPGTVSESLP
jgi:hypothetical protein